MIVTTAFLMLGISTVGGAVLWAVNDLREKRKERKYKQWRSKWHLIKGGLDGDRE